MKQARVGFIGAGNFISAFHLLTVRDLPLTDIRAIADLEEGRLASHAARMKVGYTTTDYRHVLQDPDVDIVIIGTKQDLHAKLIVESLDAGKWVYCEKPMAETSEQTRAVLEAERRAKGRLAVGFNRRFAPAYMKAKQLLSAVPKPWFINYRLMWPTPKSISADFYDSHEHILYEGTHILDLVSWFLGAKPVRVYMSGQRLKNNACVISYDDGSEVSFMCGDLGSYCLWKEYAEFFAAGRSVTVSDFVDLRARGIEGEFDQTFGTYMNEHEAEVKRFGFDFYEAYHTAEVMRTADQYRALGMGMEAVRRPTPFAFDVAAFGLENPECWSFQPDKGWRSAIEHFARCFLDNTVPQNADARAGAQSTQLALDLLRSCAERQAVTVTPIE